MNGIRRFFAILIGLVLMAGGLLKLNDPVGTGLIVSEYFKWMHLGFLQGGSTLSGALLGLLESILGAALLTGVARKAVAIATTVLLGFFTLVTDPLMEAFTDEYSKARSASGLNSQFSSTRSSA